MARSPRRRDDFFAIYTRALAPASPRGRPGCPRRGRARPPPGLGLPGAKGHRAVARHRPLGDSGRGRAGNHERSGIPYPLLAAHPRINVFDRPRTFRLELGRLSVALSGFPFQREAVHERTPQLPRADRGARRARARRRGRRAERGERRGPKRLRLLDRRGPWLAADTSVCLGASQGSDYGFGRDFDALINPTPVAPRMRPPATWRPGAPLAARSRAVATGGAMIRQDSRG